MPRLLTPDGRAKAIKNKVEVNMELTAEEWKRRFEKEREAHLKTRVTMEGLEAEVAKWRHGQFVPEKERALPVRDGPGPLTSSVDLSTSSAGMGPQASVGPLSTESSGWEAEKLKLCQLLDERVWGGGRGD